MVTPDDDSTRQSNVTTAQSPLSIPLYRGIWIANLLSNLGFLIQSVGASWLMLELTSSPRMVALVQTSITLPIMLLALFAGAVADNLDRRRVMLTAQCFMLTVSVLLALLTYFGFASPYMLLTFTFLIGCGNALNGPAWQASVGDIVPKPMLPAAVALNSAAFNIARSAGPALGGAIVAFAGAAAAFLVNCISYFGLLAVLLRWRPEQDANALPPERIGSAMMGGLRYVSMSPHMLKVMARAIMFSICASAVSALMPVITRDLLQGDAITYGILLGAFGAGAVAGALLSSPLRHRLSAGGVVSVASAIMAVGGAITALSTNIMITVPALVIAGAAWILVLSTLNVTMQLASPRWVVARAISLYQMAAFGGMAIGSSLFGMAATHIGVTRALLLACLLLCASIIGGRFMPLPQVDDVDLNPLRRWNEPNTDVPVDPRNGPVAITIHYKIDPANISRFLAVMNERRRIRRRDGARRWTLYRDLSNTRLWVERYHVATWLDYVRHNQRRTNADAANIADIMELHCDESPPLVYRRIQVQPDSYNISGSSDDGLYSQPLPGNL
ncbi:MFS transporter [Parasphingorhabdus sp.]|uniref:MFS transporter n=1 Tax=Parasphingorhabdus sp. TaxID=2709688 RepID=UPI003A8D27C1